MNNAERFREELLDECDIADIDVEFDEIDDEEGQPVFLSKGNASVKIDYAIQGTDFGAIDWSFFI